MPRLQEKDRLKVIELKGQGLSNAAIARIVNCSPPAVANFWNKYQSKSTIKDLPRPGRPRKMSASDTRYLKRALDAGKFETAVEARSNMFQGVSVQTVRRALKRLGARAYCKDSKPLLTDEHKARRLKYAQEHLDWTVEDWHSVWFSDEAAFYRVNTRGNQYVWDYPENEFSVRRCKLTVAHGGGNVSVFAVVSNQGFVVWDFVNSHLSGAEYKKVLKTKLLPSINKYWPQGGDGQLCFMQDNAPWHTARVAQEYLDSLADSRYFNIMDWPAHSPDLNVLENVWAALKRHLRRFPIPPSLDALRALMLEQVPIFNVKNRDLFTNLYASLPKRMELVVKAQGAGIRY